MDESNPIKKTYNIKLSGKTTFEKLKNAVDAICLLLNSQINLPLLDLNYAIYDKNYKKGLSSLNILKNKYSHLNGTFFSSLFINSKKNSKWKTYLKKLRAANLDYSIYFIEIADSGLMKNLPICSCGIINNSKWKNTLTFDFSASLPLQKRFEFFKELISQLHLGLHVVFVDNKVLIKNLDPLIEMNILDSTDGSVNSIYLQLLDKNPSPFLNYLSELQNLTSMEVRAYGNTDQVVTIGKPIYGYLKTDFTIIKLLLSLNGISYNVNISFLHSIYGNIEIKISNYKKISLLISINESTDQLLASILNQIKKDTNLLIESAD